MMMVGAFFTVRVSSPRAPYSTGGPPGQSRNPRTGGQSALSGGRFAEAGNVYQILLATDKSSSFYYRAYGVCCEQTGRSKEATEALDRAITLDPQDAHALTTRASIRLREGDKGAALEDLKTAQATPDGQQAPLAKRIQTLMRSAS